MRALSHWLFPSLLAAVTLAVNAFAQPPAARGKRAPVATPSTKPSGATLDYLAGRQPLAGLHAPSSKSMSRDLNGRAMLTLTTCNRNESLSVRALSDDGGFTATDLDGVAHLLRASSDDEHPIDPRLLSTIYRLQMHFGVPEIRVISGYRVPKPGTHSNHGRGRALDLIVPGVADEEVARYGRELGFTGVGVYPTSQFVHLDIRPRSYFWVDFSGPHKRNREHGILGDVAARSDAAALARGQRPVEAYGVATDLDAFLRARGDTALSKPSLEDEADDESEN